MAKIRQPQQPPNEIALWSVGPLRTVSYGVINITPERLLSAYNNYLTRGRQIAFSWEHPDENAEPELRGAPAVCGLRLSEDGTHLDLVDISWTARAAGPVSRGEWPWISPEFVIDKEDQNYLCIEKIALTTNPETCGARPIIALSRVRGKAIMLAKTDKESDVTEEPEDDKLSIEPATESTEEPEQPVGLASETPKSEPEDDDEKLVETNEKKHIQALKDAIAAVLAATSVDDCRRVAMEAAAIVASMDQSQQAEERSEILESTQVEPDDSEEKDLGLPSVNAEGNALTTAENEDEMSADDKKKLAILTEHIGGGTPDELEAKLFALKLSEKRAASVNDANAQHQAVKLAIGDLIRGGYLNPETDKEEIEKLHSKSPQFIESLKVQLSVKTPTESRQPVITGGADFAGTVQEAIRLGSQRSYEQFISGTKQHISRGK